MVLSIYSVANWQKIGNLKEDSLATFVNFRRKVSKSRNKPGPAQVGAISKAQNSKRTSKCQFTVLENRKSKKNGPSGAAGPASASPWRAKRGTLPKLSTFLSQLKGGSFGLIFLKSHNAEKLKGGTL